MVNKLPATILGVLAGAGGQEWCHCYFASYFATAGFGLHGGN